MTEAYPLPSHAASIWFTGDSINIAFPPQGPEEKGSTIVIPLDRCGIETNNSGAALPSQRGWSVILTTLKQRAASAREFRKLGQSGTPSQYDVERALVNDKKYATILGALARDKAENSATKAHALAQLKELGLL